MILESSGFDLTSTRPRLVIGRLEGKPPRFSNVGSESFDPWRGHSLLEVDRRASVIEPGVDLFESARADWPRLREAFEPIPGLVLASRIRPVGVAFPRNLSPLARRLVPTLLGFSAASARGLHADVRSLIGVEAAAALALQAMAEGLLETPAEVVLGTGSGPSLEWTAAVLERVPGPGGTAPGARLRLGRTVGPEVPPSKVFEALGVAPPTKAVVSGGLPDLGPTIRLEGDAVALGAARFALGYLEGWAVPRRIAPGPFEVSTGCPTTLGLVGRNGRGEWAWRRLLSAGSPLPSLEVAIESDDPGPAARSPLLIAEGGRSDRLWLPSEDWAEAEVRMHSTVVALLEARPVRTEPRAHRWTLRASSPDARWAMFRWEARYSPA